VLERIDSSAFVGGAVGKLRNEIAQRALERTLAPERRSILADIVAKRTVDRIVEWANERDDSCIFAWADSVLTEYPYEMRLFNVMPSTVSAALDVLSEEMPLADDIRSALTELQQRIDIHLAQSYARRQESQLQTLDPIDMKIDELLFRLSAQDSLTAEHSRSVGMWCWRIARKMSLSRAESYLVTRSGLLHDVGKTFTPVEILTAPRGLNEEEWEIMRQHAAEGEKIVDAVSDLRVFKPGVRSHHERFDGRGYPDALERASIPLAARIVAVADSFNAMIARRPYRAPFTPSRAIEELKKFSGTQWDPAIVQSMIDVVLSGR
jgi:HD-GYP domain-containing protein (c-di-GMP phosphodiesterase class II)